MEQRLSRHRDNRFWQLQPVKWWIQGHGRDGYSFRLLLIPLLAVFVLEFVCVMLDALFSALIVSGAMTLFLGIAGYYGAKREWLVPSAPARALVKARTKQAAQRSIGSPLPAWRSSRAFVKKPRRADRTTRAC